MIVTYAPDGGEPRTWTYKPEDLPSSEAEAIEDALGGTFDQFGIKLLEGGMKARRALLWMLLRRTEPGLKFSNVEFRVGELRVEFDRTERNRVRTQIEKADIPEADREVMIGLLDEEDAKDASPAEPDPEADAEQGKKPAAKGKGGRARSGSAA